MCKLNKYIKAIEEENIFTFHLLINKYGEEIFNGISTEIPEENLKESIYFLILVNLWNSNKRILKKYIDLKEYIKENIKVVYDDAQKLILENINDFLEQKENLKGLRKIHYMNERIINNLLITDVKAGLKIKECFYEIVLNSVSGRVTETRTNTGLIHSRSTNKNLCCYYVYIITLDKIYVRGYNIYFKKVLDSYKEFPHKDIDSISFVGTREMNLLERNMVLTFKQFKDIVVFKSKNLKTIQFKKALLILLDPYNLRIKKLDIHSEIQNII